MIYYLVGYMGCGKSTIAKEIGNKYNVKVIDTDAEIERMLGLSIKEAFDKYGEDYFRTVETQVLKQITENNDNCVVSCGGGLPCFNDNMTYINAHGISVYIKVSLEEIISRLSKLEIEKRPILIDKDINSFIPNQLKEREYFYNKSKYIYDENFNLTNEFQKWLAENYQNVYKSYITDRDNFEIDYLHVDDMTLIP